MTQHHRSRFRRRHDRRGTTLLETVIGTVVGTVLVIGALTAIDRIVRVRREQDARAAARSTLDQATTVLAADLRPLATVAAGDDPSDLRAVSDTALEITATIGGGIACAIASAPGGTTVDLPAAPDGPGLPILGWWAAPPRAGDLAFVHDDAGTAAPDDDAWAVRPIRTVGEGTSYCRTGPFALAASSAGSRLRLTLDGPALLPTAAVAGAPLRIARRRRYSLYRATDGWQLGVRDWTGTDWETVQPLAGPFASAAAGGLRFEAVDLTDAPVLGSTAGVTSRAVAEFRVRMRTLCSARDRRLRCADTALAVVRPRGDR